MGTSHFRSLFPPPASAVAPPKRADAVFAAILLFLAFALIGLARSHAPLSVRRWFEPLPIQGLPDLALLFASIVAAILAHEGGHFSAALTLGFRMLGGSIGPFQIQTLHRKWKFSFRPNRLLTGSISAVPGSLNRWRPAMLIVVMAGPVATFASAVTTAFLRPASHSFQLFQLAFVQISLLIFVLGLIPNSPSARSRNDARLFLDLALNNQGAEEMELYVALSQQVLAGARPQDYPDFLMIRMAAWRGRLESQVVFAQALVRWALDSDQPELACAWDLRALALAEQCDQQLQNHARAGSACLDLLFREDSESARLKFQHVDFAQLFPKFLEHRARACHQVSLGRLHRAPPEIIRAQYALPRGIPAYDLERALLENLHMRVLLPRGARVQTASA